MTIASEVSPPGQGPFVIFHTKVFTPIARLVTRVLLLLILTMVAVPEVIDQVPVADTPELFAAIVKVLPEQRLASIPALAVGGVPVYLEI